MDLSYAGNFLYMLLATPGEHYVVDPVMEKARAPSRHHTPVTCEVLHPPPHSKGR